MVAEKPPHLARDMIVVNQRLFVFHEGLLTNRAGLLLSFEPPHYFAGRDVVLRLESQRVPLLAPALPADPLAFAESVRVLDLRTMIAALQGARFLTATPADPIARREATWSDSRIHDSGTFFSAHRKPFLSHHCALVSVFFFVVNCRGVSSTSRISSAGCAACTAFIFARSAPVNQPLTSMMIPFGSTKSGR